MNTTSRGMEKKSGYLISTGWDTLRITLDKAKFKNSVVSYGTPLDYKNVGGLKKRTR